jgi:NAD-dependent dihydropyrimidine dehydrogenase PreA subunit/flavodoxin
LGLLIFYLSGTGNSLYAARTLAEQTEEELISIADLMNGPKECFEYLLKQNERIGFVFPVYAWAPPEIIFRFIKRLRLSNFQSNYVFTVITCGGALGDAMKVMKEELVKNSLKLNNSFSLVMPNNYMILGNVDLGEQVEKKLEAADIKLKQISSAVLERKDGMFIPKGRIMPWLLTSVINPMFSKNAINTKKFYAEDNCNGCGLCERVCNCNTIKFDGKPTWGKDCIQCLACINLCPVTAIQYGKGTAKKGRYKNPRIYGKL